MYTLTIRRALLMRHHYIDQLRLQIAWKVYSTREAWGVVGTGSLHGNFPQFVIHLTRETYASSVSESLTRGHSFVHAQHLESGSLLLAATRTYFGLQCTRLALRATRLRWFRHVCMGSGTGMAALAYFMHPDASDDEAKYSTVTGTTYRDVRDRLSHNNSFTDMEMPRRQVKKRL